MATIDLNGTVYWVELPDGDPRGRVEGAAVRYAVRDQTHVVVSDRDGNFSIQIPDDVEALELTVLHEDSRPITATVEGPSAATHLELKLLRPQSEAVRRTGTTTLVVMASVLVLMVALYVVLHAAEAPETQARFQTLASALHALPGKDRTEREAAYASNTKLIREMFIAIETGRVGLDGDLRSTLDRILAIPKDADEGQLESLAALKKEALSHVERLERRYFWSSYPWLFAELWFWGIFGVLAAKIMRIGWYLRSGTYLPAGNYMHWSHVVATPVVGVVAVLLLSLVQFKSGSQVVVDLSDPILMLVLAFLLSTNPWGLWDFIVSKGKEALGGGGGKQKQG